MKIQFNTLFKNESSIFECVLPIWKNYNIDKFVFYNDSSTDDSIDIIYKHLPKEKVVILNDNYEKFHEAHFRSRMLEYSRNDGADYVLTIDADELLTSNLATNLVKVCSMYDKQDILLYWYNCVESIDYYRTDPAYKENYRSFILPMKFTQKFNLDNYKYHTPRTPYVNLPKTTTDKFGVIHLQSIDRKYYAIKQLWYKHFEFVEYGHSIDEINKKYDFVINDLNFEKKEINKNLINNIVIDYSKIYDNKKLEYYLQYINENLNKGLVTFGQEYL